MRALNIGDALQTERLRLGLTVDDVAARTRIQARFLTSIEKCDWSVFPGIVFARNFVRQYATALEMDPEPLLEAMPRLDQESVRLPDPPAHPRAKRTRLGNPVATSIGWGLAAVAALVAAWVYHDQPWKRIHPDFSALLHRRTSNATVKVAANRPPALTSSTPTAQVAAVQPQQQIAQVPAATPIPQSPVALPAGTNESRPVQVVVTAIEAAWVRLTADNRAAFVGILQPNESRVVSAFDAVNLRTGNAGGIAISLNGKTIDPIGPKGQVRTVRLTVGGPELLTATPTPADAPAPESPI